MSSWLTLLVQLAVASAIGVGVVAACRWVERRSPLCARLVAAGLLVRAGMMLILFWTSFLNVPMLRQQHTGDGFWRLLPDARVYYRLAFTAAHDGFGTIVRGGPSPAFVKALALWMRAVGSSPMSGPYLNLVVYVLLCVTIVAAFRPAGNRRTDLPCALMVAAVSFSPVLVIHSAEPLKDSMFVFLIGIVCVAAFAFLPMLTMTSGVLRRPGAGVLTAAIFLAALYVISGIRAYYAAIVWSALALVLTACAWRQRRLVRYAAVCVLLLAAGWRTYMTGADLDYINPYRTVIDSAMVATLDYYRSGFVTTPGGTSVRPSRPAPRPQPAEEGAPSSIERPSAASSGVVDRLTAVGVGLSLLFVPVSALRMLSIVSFSGGRGLLAITDVDTLFMDLTIAAGIAFLLRRRSAIRGQLPYVAFVVVLATASALLMAYVVTNFGTLFRLRLMVAAPLWMLPLALSARVEHERCAG